MLGAVEIEGSDFSPPSLAVGLNALPSFVALSAPANASVENAIRLTPAATEDNLSMRFTLHVIDERRYGEPARTRNSLDQPAFRRALAKPFVAQPRGRERVEVAQIRHLQRAPQLGFLGEKPELVEDFAFGPQTDRGPGLVTGDRANALANLVPPRLGKLKSSAAAATSSRESVGMNSTAQAQAP